MKSFLIVYLLSTLSLAADLNQPSLKNEFQTLGDNKDVIERVKKLDNQQKVRIVQNRLVSRTNRIELSMNYGSLFGADTYVKTSQLGVNIQYHINPHWSFGGELQKSYNKLSAEGDRQYSLAYNCQQQNTICTERFSGVDFPIETQLLSLSYYPIYGKLNLFDKGIAQFDLYTSLGYGLKKLNSGSSNVFAAALGVGVWVNELITTRFEIRYENYKDLLDIQARNQSAVSAIASLGILIW